MIKIPRRLGASFVALLLTVVPLAAQLPGSQVGEQNLRPYIHVFIAYAIVIVLVGVWAGAIAKKIGEVERRLAE